jgi:hypothetical protein
MSAIINGSVQAYLDDLPVLAYQARAQEAINVHISPAIAINQFAAVFAAGSPLRQWANAGIVAMSANNALRSQGNDLWGKYFAVNNLSPGTTPDSLNWGLLGAVLGLVGATIICWACAGSSSRFRSVLRWVSVPAKFAGNIDSRAELASRLSAERLQDLERD